MKRTGHALALMVLLLPSPGSWAGRVAGVVSGGVAGLAAGTAVTLGVVVARARLEGHYLESTRDLLSVQALPIPAGLVGGVAAGAAGGATLAVVGGGALAGAVMGAGAGAALGAVASDEPEDTWAGGVMGGALGVLIGVVIGLALARRPARRESGSSGERVARAGVAALAAVPGLSALTALVTLAGCSVPEPEVPAAVVAVSEAASPVESVVYLVGDPGKARARHYPILERLSRDVDRWSARLADSSVVVLMLGDIVYPDGMHPPDSPEFPTDSARVEDQVSVVRGERAVASGARGVFLAGNHDWGLEEDREGARRLRNLGAFLDRVRSRGPHVDLVPTAGSGAPHVMDLGDHLRLILLDTAWWLFDAEPTGKEAMLEGVARAVAGAGERRVVMAAHHPFESAGPHGGLVPFWRTAGIYYLLSRSGALLQDLNSRPYAELRSALGAIFERAGRPLLFAGGHEHSLQLIRHDTATAPRFSVVSGSASKLTDVGPIPGTLFQESAPGYMRVVVRENGAVDLFVEAAPDRYLSCPESDEAPRAWERCMEEGVAAFRTLFSTRLAAAR